MRGSSVKTQFFVGISIFRNFSVGTDRRTTTHLNTSYYDLKYSVVCYGQHALAVFVLATVLSIMPAGCALTNQQPPNAYIKSWGRLGQARVINQDSLITSKRHPRGARGWAAASPVPSTTAVLLMLSNKYQTHFLLAFFPYFIRKHKLL